MASTFTTNKSIEKPAAGSYNDTWATPVNADFDDIDNAFGGNTQISVTGVSAGTYTLALAQYQPPNIVFSGVMGGNLGYIVPAGVGGLWTIFNNTTGAFTLAFGSGGGGAVNIPQGTRLFLVCDGVNVELVATPTASANPTATVELAAVNGSATTFMRSDAAPPLDQSISPTWTGTHEFSAAVGLNGHTSIAAGGFLQLAAGGASIDATAGAITVPTQAPGDNSTKAASTQFVAQSFAPLESPDLTGTPVAPTAAPGTDSTQIATTAFVTAAVNAQIVKCGITVALNAGVSNQINFPTPFPNACQSVVVSPFGANSTYEISSYSLTNFFMVPGNSVQFTWIAVGF
jgi:hypothetical protein